MKILVLGDPHGNLRKIKRINFDNVDLILINGDIGKADLARKKYFENTKRKKEGLEELNHDAKYFKKVWLEIYNSSLDILKYLSKYASVYTILGNVGTNMAKDSERIKEERKHKIRLPSFHSALEKIKNFNLVKNRVRNISGLRIGFFEYFDDVCWYKEYNNNDKKKIKKAKKETEKAKKILKNFNDLDILVCHQPPYGYLDKTNHPSAPKEWKGKHAGSKVILDYIKKKQPRYVFCGHIHEGEGKAKIGKTEVYNLGVAGNKIIEYNYSKDLKRFS